MASCFATVLSKLRREKDISQRRAAADLNISQALVIRRFFLRAKAPIPKKLRKKLSMKLKGSEKTDLTKMRLKERRKNYTAE